jgi:dGTPase
LSLATKRFHAFKDDFRDPFFRDRDRVIHTSSFRRLEYKTQVFINHDGDYFRTRLTHSIEVSQIARTISKSLGFNEGLAEVIALSHDLGHTPFGHVGGDALDESLKADGFVNGFEHNYQSFRVVTKLEKRYKEFDGLNLTYATLEGILKHSSPYHKPFFPKKLVKKFHLDYHPSLEAVIVDYSDEIAYICADIDDGLKYGLITYDDLEESGLIQSIIKKVKSEGLKKKQKLFRYRFVALLISELIYQFLEHSKHHTYDTSAPLCKSIKADEKLQVGFAKEDHTLIKKLKKILFNRLYKHHEITRKMFFGQKVVKGLYSAMMSDKRILSYEVVQKIETSSHHRVVADYIAGMSDRYAIKLYHELHG